MAVVPWERSGVRMMVMPSTNETALAPDDTGGSALGSFSILREYVEGVCPAVTGVGGNFGLAVPPRADEIVQVANGDSPVQLTTSRIGKNTWLMPSLL